MIATILIWQTFTIDTVVGKKKKSDQYTSLIGVIVTPQV